MYTTQFTHTHKHFGGEMHTRPQKPAVSGDFSHTGPDTKSWNIKRRGLGVHYSGPRGSVSQPWGSGKLSTTLSTLPTSPSSDRSTWSLSQKSQCPSGVPGKLDKWKARGGEVGRPVILHQALSLLGNETRGKVGFLITHRGDVYLLHRCLSTNIDTLKSILMMTINNNVS